jgi:ribonuclease HI
MDAAMKKSAPGGVVGVICRSKDGAFLGVSTRTIAGITDPTTMEAISCREAFALVQDLMLSNATIASDCLTIVQALNQEYSGSLSMVTEEVKDGANQLAEVFFRHDNRASNSEAHRLADFVVSSVVGRQVWFDQPPDGLCIKLNILVQ